MNVIIRLGVFWLAKAGNLPLHNSNRIQAEAEVI